MVPGRRIRSFRDAKATNPTTRHPVVVVHGLWLNGLECFLLRDRVRRAGFAPTNFHYPSMQATLAEAAGGLAARLRALGDTAHVVAHSLGGLVVCEAFARHAGLPAGRIVLLGSPIRGSRTARAVASHWYGPAALGSLAIAELARERDPVLPPAREIGVIAGSLSLGIGRLFAQLPVPNDGTVSLDETALPGATASVVLDVSHTGMLYSTAVANSVTRFLESGHF